MSALLFRARMARVAALIRDGGSPSATKVASSCSPGRAGRRGRGPSVKSIAGGRGTRIGIQPASIYCFFRPGNHLL